MVLCGRAVRSGVFRGAIAGVARMPGRPRRATLPAMGDQQPDEVEATSDEGRPAQALRRLKKRRDFGTHVSA